MDGLVKTRSLGNLIEFVAATVRVNLAEHQGRDNNCSRLARGSVPVAS